MGRYRVPINVKCNGSHHPRVSVLGPEVVETDTGSVDHYDSCTRDRVRYRFTRVPTEKDGSRRLRQNKRQPS